MRILFMHHFPLELEPVGQLVKQWASALVAAGHHVRILTVDSARRPDDRLSVRRIICRPGDPVADLPFGVPYFATAQPAANGTTFVDLADAQLVEYREKLRRHLDVEVDQFNPDVIHAQHLWVQGQLAVETGVPYLINAWGPELADCARDPRYRAWAEQAAENAFQILVPNDAVRRNVVETFEGVADLTLTMPPELSDLVPGGTSAPSDAHSKAAAALLTLYQRAIAERFGKLP